ncbi:MAG: hypothetical protein P1R58_04530 [bacterium]|nr:hypothetical protein [bacterium]
MTEKTRKRLVLSTLPAALLWAAFNIGDKKSAEPLPPPNPIAAIATPAPNPTGAPGQVKQIRVFGDLAEIESSPWGSDPFCLKKQHRVNAPRATTITTSYALSGILYNADDPVAIVNKRPVRVGQDIDGATVLNIEQNRVVLEHDGKRQTLRVSKG